MDKNTLTGKIALFERQVNEIRIEQQALQDKLRYAYEYKDRLKLQLAESDDTIKALQEKLFEVSNGVAPILEDMKQAFEVYVGEL